MNVPFLIGGIDMLKGQSFFPLLKLVNKVGIKEEIRKLVQDVSGKSEEEKANIQKEKGIDLMFVLLEKLGGAEKETFDFLSSHLEKPVEEVKKMDMFEIGETFKDLFADERFKVFFQKAMK